MSTPTTLEQRFRLKPNQQGILEWLDPRIQGLRRWAQVGLDIKRSPYRLPFTKALKAWTYGFSDWSYRLYDLDSHNPGDYLTDRAQALKGRDILGFRSGLVLDKWNFSHLLNSVGIPQPTLFGRLHLGRFFPQPDCPEASIGELLQKHTKLVLKPTRGCGGWGLLFLRSSQDNVTVNGMEASPRELQQILFSKSEYVVTAFAEQHAYASTVFPKTTNTLRLLVLWDDESDEPYIAATAQRFGWGRCNLLDNFSGGRGGLSAEVDHNGVMGPARTLDRSGRRIEFSHHPDTGEMIEGLAVPDWEYLTSELLGAVTKMPFLRGIGWDLVKTAEGWECLEGNPAPGTKVWQVHRGLLCDERTRRFYRQYGMC